LVQELALAASHAVQAIPLPPHWESDLLVTHPELVQQPFGQFEGEQSPQMPFVHSWPGPHGVHELPPVPHPDTVLPAWQVPFWSQQPLGQLVELQTQLPPTQTLPAPQAAPGPHLQVPLEQLSVGPPAPAPPAPARGPHAAASLTEQVFPLQHPTGQLDALHTHWPAMHS
jgi:hypothetical protein